MVRGMEYGFFHNDQYKPGEFYGWIPGIGENIHVVVKGEKLYVLGQSCFYSDEYSWRMFFTNDSAYKNKLPDFFEVHDDEDIEFVYKDIK